MQRKFYPIIMSLLLLFVIEANLPQAQAKDKPLFYPLNIMQEDGTWHEFQVEYPKTAKDKAKGLMFRTSLPADKGMIFYYPRAQNVRMWMENTYIPLDMLFIAHVENRPVDNRPENRPVDNRPENLQFGGQIVHIVTDTVPLSRAVIGADKPVIAVIELQAGQVGARQLKIGDKVYWNLKEPVMQ